MAVQIQEVGPRDGLQNEATLLSTGQKLALIDRLARAGLRRIEAGSFVHPRAVPAMADSDQVFARLERHPGVAYGGLVLNERGYRRAVAAQVDEVHFSFAVTESFNRRNQRARPEESMALAASLAQEGRTQGLRLTLTLGAAFGCPFEGPVDEGQVIEYARQGAEVGFDEIVLADTIGVGVPSQAARLVRRAIEATGGRVPIGVHLHNTRNTGLANAYAALEAGAVVFDASVGGLGGCPFAPKATGNIATEALVYMPDGMGVATGIDLDALLAAARWLEEQVGHPLEGMVMKAGPFRAAPQAAEGAEAHAGGPHAG